MSTSQNGWNAGPKTEIHIVSPKVPGTNVDFPQGVLAGDVETVLMYVAAEFHRTVEPLVDGHCWGYFYKNIEGSNELSNHASGTAIDLNAPAHPMGKANTFSAAKVAAIRKILAFLEGVVRWGGDYSGRKDDMHFEINKGAAEVARIAAKIRALGGKPAPAPKPPAAPKPPQLALDGKLGPATIRRWQQVMGTPVDGKISEVSSLVKAVQRHLNSKIKAGLAVDGKGIRQDNHVYQTVRALQRYLGTPQDGRMSVPVSDVVKAIQRRLNSGKF
ncbi:M15 family metallopeptidase [Micromonospora krabiensis]|uniref:D-alanyl-D-alanine carboxypeptidase n=1 Tax=Micromonospora krabiensis TaxID=307121 RepID=A0A1C3N5T2_9ACTN|nr:M15 family metallopeptidase [Micromonospora krabiensis]SBV27937.1 D-alanyl-D-alanine carboxypeptidase [Micromonospora krabiensis]